MARLGRSHRVGEAILGQRVVVVRRSTVLERHAARPDSGVAKVLSARGVAAERLEAAHEQHRESCSRVVDSLRGHGFDVRVVAGLRRRDAREADLVVTVGGDGTFLRASHCVEADDRGDGTPMLGINSSPETSVGFFCAAHAGDLDGLLARLRRGEVRSRPLWRMRVSINGEPVPDPALNDILVAHRVPAETTRYTLRVDGKVQRQKSSGIWVSTAAGSTGAIRSAGGEILDLDDRRVQFRVRELFPLSVGDEVPLVGGAVAGALEIESHTAAGVLYVDGAHRKVRFGMGDRLRFETDPHPLPWLAPSTTDSRRDALRLHSQRVLAAAGLRVDPERPAAS